MLATDERALVRGLSRGVADCAELVRRGETAAGRVSITPAYRAFQDRYRADPVGFMRDCVRWPPGQAPAVYQERIARALVKHRRVSARGPHALGKTTTAALIILWFALTRDGLDWKAPTTASAWRQLSRYLWPEVHKWARRLRWDVIGRDPFAPKRELLDLSLKLGTGEAFAVASDSHDLIEGAHADHMLYVFDESKAIPIETWDAAEGAFAGAGADTPAEALALSISTPGEPQGRFYEIQQRKPGYEDWHVVVVTMADAIKAGRMSRDWAEQRRRQWGEGSAVYRNRVLGEFASSDEDGVIPLAWVEAAMARWAELRDAGLLTPEALGSLTALGLDVADGGQDRSILAPRYGMVIPELRDVTAKRAGETMSVAGAVAGVLRLHGGRAVVDSVGVGAGVVSRLREMQTTGDLSRVGIEIVAFGAGEGTTATDASGELGFVNVRSAGLWRMRELLDPESLDPIALPEDDGLVGDLTAPHWRVMSAGRIAVESKDDIRKRLRRSTDMGDAVVMAFWDEAEALAKRARAGVPAGAGLLGGVGRGSGKRRDTGGRLPARQGGGGAGRFRRVTR